MYSMQISFTLWPGSVQLFNFLIETVRHHVDIISNEQQNYHSTRLSIICTLQTRQSVDKLKTHCRQSVKQTAQRAEKVVEHTVPNKNRSGVLNAMCSTRRETKDTREIERATRDETETLLTGSRASNARRNGNGTDEKSSEQCATERKRDVRKSERKTRNNETGRWERTIGKWGRKGLC